MKALIVEDEFIAAERLKKLIKACNPEIEILEVLDSVIKTANYLDNHQPDLIFLDVQLSDGICFELFEKIEIDTPIIFTTAYDEYLQKAFSVNSVDYLLKPIRKEDLERSISKFKKLNYSAIMSSDQMQLLASLTKHTGAYKCRFMVRSGRAYISLSVKDIAYIYAQNKLNYMVSHDGKKYPVEFTLDELKQILDPLEFIKINRNYIISNSCIQKVEPYFNNRMLVSLIPEVKDDVIVSRSYLKDFKKWMEM